MAIAWRIVSGFPAERLKLIVAIIVRRLTGEKPLASPLAREQARTGSIVTTGRHESTRLSAADQHALHALDGTNSVADVALLTKTSKDIVREQIGRFAKLALILS
jgi:hypothetical protein